MLRTDLEAEQLLYRICYGKTGGSEQLLQDMLWTDQEDRNSNSRICCDQVRRMGALL
jgi:hypothetical protein